MNVAIIGSLDIKDVTPKGSPEGKILAIDTVSQNRLNTIKNHEI